MRCSELVNVGRPEAYQVQGHPTPAGAAEASELAQHEELSLSSHPKRDFEKAFVRATRPTALHAKKTKQKNTREKMFFKL